jgi:hypothetical protein
MKNLCIVYPIGGGGHWLSSVIRQLEFKNKVLPHPQENTTWFDQLRLSDRIETPHGASWQTGNFIKDDLSSYKKIILFSTEYLFNLYLLDVGKAKFNPMRNGNILDLSIVEQFFSLTDYARFIITDQDYVNFYCKNIQLNSRLIFQDPEQFIIDLFDLLDNNQLPFDRDRDYCLQSINIYLKTCMNPKDHLGNFESLSWLGWCHALSMIYNLPLNGILKTAESIDDIASILYPHKDQFIKLTKPMMFYWNQ